MHLVERCSSNQAKEVKIPASGGISIKESFLWQSI
jgi:hypothetical protein